MRCFFLALILLVGCTPKKHYSLILRNGTIYDGSGNAPYKGDVAIQADTLAAIGTFQATADSEVDVQGMVIAPGFIKHGHRSGFYKYAKLGRWFSLRGWPFNE